MWVADGAEAVHVVNLNGTLTYPASGASNDDAAIAENLRRTEEIRRAVSVPVQFAGGLRSRSDLELAFALGVDRVVVGTAAITDPDLLVWAHQPPRLLPTAAVEGRVLPRRRNGTARLERRGGRAERPGIKGRPQRVAMTPRHLTLLPDLPVRLDGPGRTSVGFRARPGCVTLVVTQFVAQRRPLRP